MDGNTLESLLAWMQAPENNVMHGWGAITVLGRKKVNELLAQQFIARATTDSWLPLVSGVVATIPGKRLDAIHGFKLGTPQLSFEKAGVVSNHATLSCSVDAGAWLRMSRIDNQWQTQSIVEIDPLLGPRVLLDLDLMKTQGVVSEDGRIVLDLKHSDDVRLTGAGTEEEQELIGTVFSNLISQLPDEQRIWELGSIDAGDEIVELMKPHAFRLQTQADPQASPGADAATDREGALLVCISMVGQEAGDTLPANYPYFLPGDTGLDYSASVLMGANAAPLGLLYAMADALGSGDFEYVENADGTLSQATLTSGQLAFEPFSVSKVDPETGDRTDADVGEMIFSATVDQPLTLDFESGKIQLNWTTRSPVGLTVRTDSEAYDFRFEVGLSFDVTYERTGSQWTRASYSLDKTLTMPSGRSWEDELIGQLIGVVLFAIIMTLIQLARDEILRIISERVDPIFADTFWAGAGLEAFTSQQITLGFGESIQSDVLYIPRDVVIFGHVNPTLTSFTVSPLQPLMAAGSSQLFVTEPSIPGVVWSAEALEGGSGEKVDISPSGLYQAPQADAVNGLLRVRVVAEDKATGNSSAALVTVLTNPMTISPLIQICSPGETVELAAKGLAGMPLQWSIGNQVPGESGEVKPSILPGGDHTYLAGPKVSDKTYVLDEVRVTGASGARSAWVLVVQHSPALVVKPLVVDVSAGEVSLQAQWNGVEIKPVWTLAAGSRGEITDDGKYKAPDSIHERFALVFATYADDMFGEVQGHIILPLPLLDFEDELTLMGDDASAVSVLSADKPKSVAKQRALASANNTLDGLVDWMANPANNVMLGWDAIAAMDRSRVNSLLLQEYIHRFSANTYLPPVSGQVPTVVNEWMESIHEFLLDAPRLAFVNDDLGNSHATLTCFILGGTQLTLKKNVDTWGLVKLTRIDPLQGPKLTLDLSLDEVAGLVDDDGRVKLDLRHSDNFILTFAESAYERKLGGDFFKDLFNQLPDEKRIWTLGVIEAGSNASMRAESFKLRTQTRSLTKQELQAGNAGDGAILTFICMEDGSPGGDIPIEYRYLIPEYYSKRYSATVLFAKERINKAVSIVQTVADALSAVIENLKFEYVTDANGRVIKATAKSGSLTVPFSSEDLNPVTLEGKTVTPRVVRYGASYSATGGSSPLTISLEGDRNALLTWKSAASGGVTLELLGSDYPVYVAGSSVSFDVTCDYVFSELSDDLVLQPTLNTDVLVGEMTFAAVDGQPAVGFELQMRLVAIAAYVIGQDRAQTAWEIQTRLEEVLPTPLPVSAFIQESIQLNFNQAIVSDILRAPGDIAAFGYVAPATTAFVISPQEHVMAVDSSITFVTYPANMAVDWNAEKLHGASEDAGGITTDGKYYAPEALAMNEPFIRVRITATDKATNYHSSALVTVVASSVSLNPLIQVCDAGSSVELAAGVLGTDEVSVSIRNPVEGESGELLPSALPDGDYTYVAIPAGEQINKTYVLDEVVLSTQPFSASAWVLVQLKAPFLTVQATVEEQQGTQVKSVRLQAFANGTAKDALWSMPLEGPGEMNGSVYIAAEQTDKHFVLIVASIEHPQLGTLQGHIILPLPLTDPNPE
ncbi:hypothetical protein SAMN05216596_101224 [Pseudomonas congelans]|uniref:Uncharacterized protein n=1 Tax=Pseudomonas congelans TaxID=200452 RepID=A0A0P9MHE1_9PSED|nr:Uncharacterized protein ALO92_00364 [Pseudomonas congelans]SDO39335.1 hypothetical protein SAMN05216596_101224 [Pseudomonas congelans]